MNHFSVSQTLYFLHFYFLLLLVFNLEMFSLTEMHSIAVFTKLHSMYVKSLK